MNKIAHFCRQHRIPILIIASSLIIFLLIVWYIRGFYGHDLEYFQINWWNYIKENGFSGIATISSAGIAADYPSIWYFFIWLFTTSGLYPALPLEICIKIFAVITTIASATFIFFIVKHLKPHTKYLPSIAFVVTLFLPSFFLDIAKSNLPDSAYICFCLGAILMLLKKRWRNLWFFIGLAISLKFMAIFAVPFLGYFYLKEFRKMSWRIRLAPIYVILAISICVIPGVIAGLNPYDASALSIIANRASFLTSYGYTTNIWEFIPQHYSNQFITAATILTAAIIAAIVIFTLKFIPRHRQQKIEFPILFTLLPLTMFFFIPGQRETYFSLAAISSVIAYIITARRDLLFVAIGINFTLAICYLNAFWDGRLFGTSLVTNLYLLTTLLGGIIIYLTHQLYKSRKT